MRALDLLNRTLFTATADAVLGVLLAAVNVVFLTGATGSRAVLVLAVAVVETAPVAVRRRWPLIALAATADTALVAAGLGLPAALPGLVAILFSLEAVASRCSPRISVPATLVIMAGSVFVAREMGFFQIGFQLVLIGAAGLLGHSARMRRALQAALSDLAASARHAREEEARRAAADERARLAREVHDVVAHSLSVIVVQAGAGRRVAGEAPDEARAALGSIEGIGREALGEIRRLLGVLRSGEPREGRRPQPSIAHLDALLEGFRASGLRVEARTEGPLDALPATIDLSAYRIVQESLTNCLRHASGALARVTVVRDHRLLLVEVVNDAGTADPSRSVNGSGHGLPGMRERVAAYGGDFEAGGRAGGGWRVRARLPLEAPE